MKMDITGRNIDITPAIREFTQEKISRLDRWIDELMEVHVVLSVEKHRHNAELVVKARHHTFTGADETGDMYASIGNAVDKIDKQARRQKDKDSARRKHATPTHEVVAESKLGPKGAESSDDDGGGALADGEVRVIRSVPQSLKPMSIDDAALLFSDSGRTFLVFREARSQRFCVLYRRKDGHLGLIEPED